MAPMTIEQEVLLHIPIASAAVWLANGLWPWIRGRRVLQPRTP